MRSELMAANDGLGKVNPIAFALNLPTTQLNSASLAQSGLEAVLKIIVGDQPMEALDDMVAKWKEQGGDASTEEVNAWFAK